MARRLSVADQIVYLIKHDPDRWVLRNNCWENRAANLYFDKDGRMLILRRFSDGQRLHNFTFWEKVEVLHALEVLKLFKIGQMVDEALMHPTKGLDDGSDS